MQPVSYDHPKDQAKLVLGGLVLGHGHKGSFTLQYTRKGFRKTVVLREEWSPLRVVSRLGFSVGVHPISLLAKVYDYQCMFIYIPQTFICLHISVLCLLGCL